MQAYEDLHLDMTCYDFYRQATIQQYMALFCLVAVQLSNGVLKDDTQVLFYILCVFEMIPFKANIHCYYHYTSLIHHDLFIIYQINLYILSLFIPRRCMQN